MKKISFLILLFYCVGFSLSAQQLTAKWGEMKSSLWHQPRAVVSKNNNGIGYVAFTKNDKNTFFSKLDPNLNLLYAKELKIGEGKEPYEYVNAFRLNNKIVLFSKYLDKKGEDVFVYATRISDEGLVEGAPVVVSKVHKDKMLEISVTALPNETNTLAAVIVSAYEHKNEYYRNYGFILDSELKQTSSWEADPEKSSAIYADASIVFDHNNLYALHSRTTNGKTNSFFVNYSGDKKAFTETALDKVILENALTKDKTGNIILTGFYASEPLKPIEGFAYVKFSPATGTISSAYKPFSADFMSYFTNEEKEINKDLNTFVLRKIVVLESGDITVVAERYYRSVIQRQSSSGNYNEEEDAYEAIMLFGFHPESGVKWFKKVAKYQIGFYGSIVPTVLDNNRIVLLYNDHKKNMDNLMDNHEKLQTMDSQYNKNAVILMVTVEPDGKVERVLPALSTENRLLLNATYNFDLGNNELLTFPDDNYKGIPGKLRF